MASTYTIEMGSAAPPANTNTTIFTTPATGVYVLRDLVLGCLSPAGTTMQVTLSDNSVNYLLHHVITTVGVETSHLELRLVLPPRSILQVFSTGNTTFRATGYQLSPRAA